MTKEEITETANSAVGERIRTTVKAVLKQILEEEMPQHVGAATKPT